MLVVVCSDTGRKVEDPELLEAIRLTIINNMLQYHPVFLCKYLFLGLTCPLIEISCKICSLFKFLKFSEFVVQESSEQLAMGVAFGITPPKQQVLILFFIRKNFTYHNGGPLLF